MPKVTKVDVYRVEMEDGKVGYATGTSAVEAIEKVVKHAQLHDQMHGKVVESGLKLT